MDDKSLDKIISDVYAEKAAADMPSEEFFTSIAMRAMNARRTRRLTRIRIAAIATGIAATLGIILLSENRQTQDAGQPEESFFTESIAQAEERIENIGMTQAALRESFDRQFPF